MWGGSALTPDAWQTLASMGSDCSALLQVDHLPGHHRLGLDAVALCLQGVTQLYTNRVVKLAPHLSHTVHLKGQSGITRHTTPLTVAPLCLQDVTQLYTLGRVLGRGQFGTTRLAEDKTTGEHLACKSISKRKLT